MRNSPLIKINSPLIKIIGIFFALIGLYFIIQNVTTYIKDCNQEAWTQTTATITNIEKRIETSGIKVKSRKLVYDLYYEYSVGNETYDGVKYGTVDYSKNIGDTVEIKYNPQNPQEYTNTLTPSNSGLISGISFGLMFIILSLALTDIIKLSKLKNLFKKAE